MSRTLMLLASWLVLTATCVAAEELPAGNPPGNAYGSAVAAPDEHRRGEDQTYLTYPEWFLVFSPAEHARFLSDQPPSNFPYFGHIGQFWSAYAAMTRAMGNRYDFNFGYHLMVLVIGTSTTVEYALKAGYEAVFGRMTEGPVTPEDELAAFIAQDYVDFILATPWYEYDFFAALRALWLDTPGWGPDLLRKWERRYLLTTEYLVKGCYAILIKAGTQAGYEAPIPLTTIVLDGLPAPRAALPELEVLASMGDRRSLVTVPRYDAFKDYASALAGEGLTFLEIAGNRGIIVTSLIAVGPLDLAVPHDLLLTQPVLTSPGAHRYVVRTTVADLAPLLRAVTARGIALEHVYDY